jgi:hypothetical protein
MNTHTAAEQILYTFHPLSRDHELKTDLWPTSTVLAAMEEYAASLSTPAPQIDGNYEPEASNTDEAPVASHSSASGNSVEQQWIDEGYIDGKKSFKFLANQIHENFNWAKVHTAMAAVGWCWSLGTDSYGKSNMGVPSIDTIKNHTYAILEQVYEQGKGSISTGGFTAGWDGEDLYLVFTLEEATTG